MEDEPGGEVEQLPIAVIADVTSTVELVSAFVVEDVLFFVLASKEGSNDMLFLLLECYIKEV